MPETTLLIKAALNLRVGAVFDVYKNTKKRLYNKMKKTAERAKPTIKQTKIHILTNIKNREQEYTI